MNMLDDEAEDFHPTRESYSHLSEIVWGSVERLSPTIGQEAVGALLSALGPGDQHATIAKFIQNELNAERGKVVLLHQQGSPTDTAVERTECPIVLIVKDSSSLLPPGRRTHVDPNH